MKTNDNTNEFVSIGGYEGLVNRYFTKIKDEIEEVIERYDYQRKSHGFAHWFLVNIKGFDPNNVSEMITDDYQDWSIDSVNIDLDNDVIELYQFKFPSNEKNIHKKIPRRDILTFLSGYKICSSGKYAESTNKYLKSKIDEIVESDIFNFKLIYVSYTDLLDDEAKYSLDEELKLIRGTGNQVDWELYDKKSITNELYSNKRKYDFEVTLQQVGSSTAIMTSDNSACYTVYCSLDEIAEITGEHENVIFEENVRLFHGVKNNYNNGIIETAKEDPVNFHLYNNGIVMLSNEVNYIDTRKTLKIKNPMVVNGCQTMNSLLVAKNALLEDEEGLRRFKEGYIQVKVIKINEPVLRQNISIYLNSQTEIKDSYLISNLPIVRQMEEDLEKLGYIFLRQANQLELLKKGLSRQNIIDKFGKDYSKTIKMELAIQTYAAFYEDYAPIAKANKAKLFNNKSTLTKIFEKLNAEKLILSYNIYHKISNVISKYRSCRRNNNKIEILKYLNIDINEIDEYTFLNTADVFLLSLFALISELRFGKFEITNKKVDIKDFNEWSDLVYNHFDEILKEAIEIIKEEIKNHTKAVNILTKNAQFHKLLKAATYKKYK